ncbi:MAG: hypothetical protein H0V01_10725 [Bacteroidetes bacterium]|nr:hypothetical protein [Bacteroidota bacterium]HET6244826.1 hypothetical protein [Bacteroidia bacterium]
MIETVITVLGWEDRFPLGMEIILSKYKVKRIVLISFIDYCSMDKMEDNKKNLLENCAMEKIEVVEVNLEYSNSINNWKCLDQFFEKETENIEYLLNITTIPRETIWALLFFLRQKNSHINYIYFKPETYCDGWLTKNYKNPRLLFKHSGVFELDKKLALFIITGFDDSRLDSLIEYYEPSKIVVFSQRGNQFHNMDRNKYIKKSNSFESEIVEFDSYDVEEATKILNDTIIKYGDSNIIISSQGPKLSSLSTYKNHLLHDSIAFAYVPAQDFNLEYSKGINPDYIDGKLEI